MARKNIKKGATKFPLPIPMVVLVIVLAGFSLLYVCMQSRTERLGREIKELESARDALRAQLVKEQNEWAKLQSPFHLDQALKGHGLAMVWPGRDQIVRVRYDGTLDTPRGMDSRPPSRVARSDRIVMND